MFYEVVGKSQSANLQLIAVVAHPFHNRRPHTTIAHTILNGYHLFEFTRYLMQHVLVEWFQESQVVVSYFRGEWQFVDGCGSLHTDRTYGDNG